MSAEEEWAEVLQLEARIRRCKAVLIEEHGFSEECEPEVRKAKPQKDPEEEVPEETRHKCAVGLLDLAVRINRDGACLTKYASALATGKIGKHKFPLGQLKRYVSVGQAHGDKVIEIMAPVYRKDFRGKVKASKDMREAVDRVVRSHRPRPAK